MSETHEHRSFGVEEEYLLLDLSTGLPVNRADELIQKTRKQEPEREFLLSQLETATPVCHTSEDALHHLRSFRTKVAAAASAQNIVLAGTGLPPVGGEVAGTVTPNERYLTIASELRGGAAVQYVTGMHVHVEVVDRDLGVEVLARLARWAPALLAMTANSPIWCGEDTGFASWRHPISVAWPLRGYPPEFSDGAEYSETVARLVESGVVLDSGVVTWAARLSEDFPTIELRIADAQLSPDDAVAFAAIVRALVEHIVINVQGGVERIPYIPGIVNGAIWMAARDGLEGSLIDPAAGAALPAFEFIEQMLNTIRAELTRFGDTELVEQYVERLRRDGGPASIQRERFRASGVTGLLDLYRTGSQIPVPLPG